MTRRMRVSSGMMVSLAAVLVAAAAAPTLGQAKKFNGLNMNLGNLSTLSDAKTRSISPENFTGEKGKGGMATEGMGKNASRDLGQGWKISPSVRIPKGTTFTLADIDGSGAIQQIWMTPSGHWRFLILRMYWDGEEEPSVECPVGDFFACGWNEYCQINSLPVNVNPGSALNCYWSMPFRKSAKITIENIADTDEVVYYQINYTLTEVPEDEAYFHAQFRRSNPLKYKEVHTIVDGIKGKGQYIGTYMALQVNSNGWWGEGEIKFYMDGDIPEGVATTDAVREHGGKYYPTICGTGAEDYFCGSYGFHARDEDGKNEYREYTTPYVGMPQVILPDGLNGANQRFGLYRWHIMDPIRFDNDLAVTIQAIGWRRGGKYLPLQDDISTTALWYQTEPHNKFPKLPTAEFLEIP